MLRSKLLCMVLLGIAGSTPAETAEYFVAPNGSDRNPGTLMRPWRSVSIAVTRVAPGDTISLLTGTYSERIVLGSTAGTESAPITLRAFPGHRPIIDGMGLPLRDGNGLVRVEGTRHWRITGLVVTGSHYYGLKVRNASSIAIEGIEVSHSSHGGLVIENSTDILVIDNHVHHTNQTGRSAAHEALTLSRVENFEVRGNEVHSNLEEGIDVKDGSKSGTVRGNHVFDNGAVGIYVDGATDVVVDGNRVHSNATAGLALGIERREPTRNIAIVNNLVYRNRDGGLQFYSETGAGIEDCAIVNNTFYGNEDAGLWFLLGREHRDNVVRNNIFLDNEVEIRDEVGARGRQRVDHNLFAPGARSHIFGRDTVIALPAFRDAENDDFHLGVFSPARDAGVADSAPEHDIEGRPRPQGRGYDLGAYEIPDVDDPSSENFQQEQSAVHFLNKHSFAERKNKTGFRF